MKGFLFGAGFDCEFGLPLLRELSYKIKTTFTSERLKKLNQGWRKQGGGFCDKAISKIINIFEEHSTNYELLVGIFKAEENNFGNRDISHALYYMRQFLLDFIFRLLIERTIGNESIIQQAVESYRGLKSLILDTQPVWFINLNHTVVIEMLAGELNIPLQNGFSEKTFDLNFDESGKTNGKFKTLNMSGKTSNPYNYFGSNQPGINLLKLHGSIDTFGFDDLKQLVCIVPKEKTIRSYIEMQKLLIQNHWIGSQKALNELVIFDKSEWGFLRKSLLSGVDKFGNQQSQIVPLQILEFFKHILNDISELVVIGYSFGDKHINDALKEWMDGSLKRKMIIVNPFIENIPQFFMQLSSQVSILKKRSIEYFGALPGGIRSPEEIEARIRRKLKYDEDLTKQCG